MTATSSASSSRCFEATSANELGESLEELAAEQKVITEFYIALLPSIVTSWTENVPRKKKEFSTVSSDVVIKGCGSAYDVNIKFKNGNSFSGSTKHKRLHGEGIYHWNDGTVYEGCFNENKLEGECKIFYSTGERYSGQASHGYHHGNGLFVSKAIRYRGDFDSGMFHGRGHLQTSDGSIEGVFKNNKIDEGIRVYADGIFSGKFNLNGERLEGCFLHSNGDIYNGKWQQDHYSGFGTYRWNPFRNCIGTENQYVIPKHNYFAGYWTESYRFGPGVLCFDERIVLTTWKFDKKFGPGIVIAANGDTFVSEQMYLDGMYREGFLVKNEEKTDKHIQNLKSIVKQATGTSLMQDYFITNPMGSTGLLNPLRFKAFARNEIEYLMEFATKRDIPPIFLPKHMINLKSTPITNFIAKYLPDVEQETLEEIEFKSINQVIASKLGVLEHMYMKYAGYGVDAYNNKPLFMLRLGLWRFLRTIHYFDKKSNSVTFLEESEYSFHLNSEDLNDPYEIIYFWQFLKYILSVTMYLNRKHSVACKAIERRPPFYGLFATMLIDFLRDHENIEAIAIDNFPVLLCQNLVLTEFIFEVIKEYQPKCPVRMTYKLFTYILGKFKGVQEANSLQFEDYIQCVSKVYPDSVLDDTLVNWNSPLTPLELFEMFILLISRTIRNKKYVVEKNKFLNEFNEKIKSLKEESNSIRNTTEHEKPLEEDDKKQKKKKKSKKIKS